MPWKTLTLTPGLNVELTPLANRGGYAAMNLGRFRNGMFQKMGGWEAYYGASFSGTPFALHAHADLTNATRVTVATSSAVYDLTSGAVSYITPQMLVTNPAKNFTTTAGSPVVTVVDAGIGNVTTLDSVFFETPVSVGGIILSGVYQVERAVSAASYTIRAAANATSGVTGGGTIPAFTTLANVSAVTVTLAAHGLAVGGTIVFPIATTVGGITIQGVKRVQSVVDADNFMVVGPNAASGNAGPTAMNSGNAQLNYILALGPPAYAGAAYGAGNYSAGDYSLGVTIAQQSGTPIAATDYTVDNWGEDTIVCPGNGGIYYWPPGSGIQTAVLISAAPYYNTGVFTSAAQEMIIAYGSAVLPSAVPGYVGIGTYQDPLLVRWCDAGDFTAWVASGSNQAGSFRIPSGSRIVGGLAAQGQNLLWTDVELWAMTYIGSQFVYGFTKLANNCGLISKRAVVSASDIYWASTTGFWCLSGGAVQQLSCPVWDIVFQDLDTANLDKCHMGTITSASEVIFSYPSKSGGTGVCDSYVKYNFLENVWDAGRLPSSVWLDTQILGVPLRITPAGSLYVHETGNDAAGGALATAFTTAWMLVGEGEERTFVDRVYPDFNWAMIAANSGDRTGSPATIQLWIDTQPYGNDDPDKIVSYGPFSVTRGTRQVSKKVRGGLFRFRFMSTDIGSWWRLGAVKVRWANDGRGP